MEEFTNVPHSSNINEKWLDNIYENIKNIEKLERYAREGCESLIEFLNIPFNQRAYILGEVQFKNLKLLISEFKLLLGDLSPLLEESKTKPYIEFINKVQKAINRRGLFIQSEYDLNGNIKSAIPTPFFYETIEGFYNLKVKLFREEKVRNILYIEDRREW